jgi:hypothetical protein
VAVGLLAIALLLVAVAVDPATCIRDDMLSLHLGASREVWLAAKHGRLALVTPRSWFGGAIAAEYQHGALSVFAVATDALAWSIGGTLRQTAFVLAAVPTAWLASGTFRLARVEGCSLAAAVLAALLATFHGWTLRWAIPWYQALSSFAWVPWLLWSIRRGGRARPFLVAVATYAIVTAGWPHTLCIAIVVGTWAIARELYRTRDPRAAASVIAGALLGACLGTPALLMLLEYGAAGRRLNDPLASHEWTVPVAALLGLLSPLWRAEWSTFDFWKARPSIELFSAVGLSMVGALAARSRAALLRAAGSWLALAAIALALACLPGRAPLRWSFRWLPLWHLAIALAAARSLDAWQTVDAGAEAQGLRGAVPRVLGHPAGLWLAIVLPTSFLAFVSGMAEPGPVLRFTLAAALACGLWWLAGRARAAAVRSAAPAVVSAAAALFVLGTTPSTDIPTWDLPDTLAAPAPLDPARTYLALYTSREILKSNVGRHVELRFGNLPLLAGLSFVNGYSPLQPIVVSRRFPFETHGWLFREPCLGVTCSPFIEDPTLADDLGIDGMIVAAGPGELPFDRLLARGWSPVASLDGGAVLHRGEGPAPRAWLLNGVANAEGRHKRLPGPAPRIEESDGETTVYLDTPREHPVLVVFKRPAYPGWQATIGSAPAPVTEYRSTLVAVPIPAGTTGPVTVRYWPTSLTHGLTVAAVAAAVLLGWLLWVSGTAAARAPADRASPGTRSTAPPAAP